MLEINTLFANFRQIARDTRNMHKLINDKVSFDDLDILKDIDNKLFSLCVLKKINQMKYAGFYGERSIKIFDVIVEDNLLSIPLMIKRESRDANNYWDEPLKDINFDALNLKFVSYFDWDYSSLVDYRYILTEIYSLPNRPDLVGRQALIDVAYCNVQQIDC